MKIIQQFYLVYGMEFYEKFMSIEKQKSNMRSNAIIT
jgi:hypothetical protein